MSIASMVPVVMLSPLMVVQPLVDRSVKLTMPEKLMDWLLSCTPLAKSRMVELDEPLVTLSVMPFTVCVREEMFPSASEMRLVRLVAVCCRAEMLPSALLMRLVRLVVVAVSCVMFPSASLSRVPSPAAVTVSAAIFASSSFSCTCTGSVMMFAISFSPASLKFSLSRFPML